MNVRLVALVLVVLAACINSASVPCGDHTCGPGTVCGFLTNADDTSTPICLTPEQSTVCANNADGDRCEADGHPQICRQHYCLPGCGDGTVDVGEECDDGNFISHDSCSSSCISELAGWREWQSAWRGRYGHSTAYHAQSQQLVVVGGREPLSVLGDQWIRDADGTWTRSTPPVAMRVDAAIAYDSSRGRLVLFGGSYAGQELGDTWEFDGTTWAQKTPVNAPSARHGAAMAFDPSSGRVVLFGGTGVGNDTWEYDGTTWTQVTIASPPAGRFWHAMAWDAARSRIVMFGGYRNGSLFDTWEYTAGSWTQVAQATRPQARFGAAMAYSTARGKIVLYGGALSLTVNGSDTWEYDGTWTAITPSLSPPARGFSTLTDDANGLVLVNGADNAQMQAGDVWRYSATGTWTDITPAFSPSKRETELVYDASRHGLVLFSGCATGGFTAPDTWTFDRRDGADALWTHVGNVSTDPPQRCNSSMTYDSGRERVVLFGGHIGGQIPNLTETWGWDGASWAPLQVTAQPLPRAEAVFADNPRDQTSVLFGGRTGTQTLLNETWELDGTTWISRPTPLELVPQQNPTMAYDADLERVVLFDVHGETWQYRDREWSRLVLDASPEPRNRARMVWDPWRHRIVMFGGTDGEIDYWDLWELHEHTWERVRLLGAQPPSRTKPALAAYPELRSLVLFGGRAHGDTWTLQFVSETPEEDCSNELDDDGDLQIDALDPDCSLYP